MNFVPPMVTNELAWNAVLKFIFPQKKHSGQFISYYFIFLNHQEKIFTNRIDCTRNSCRKYYLYIHSKEGINRLIFESTTMNRIEKVDEMVIVEETPFYFINNTNSI